MICLCAITAVTSFEVDRDRVTNCWRGQVQYMEHLMGGLLTSWVMARMSISLLVEVC